MARRHDQVEAKLDVRPGGDGVIFDPLAGLTRAGVFRYADGNGGWRREYRPPREVFRKESLDTLCIIPVVDTHGAGLVTPETVNKYRVGQTGERYVVDGMEVFGPVKVDSAEGLAAVAGGRSCLSLAYECDLVNTPGRTDDGEEYDCVQTNIRYNNLALVEAGRAGEMARIHLDEGDAVRIDEATSRGLRFDGAGEHQQEPSMKKKIKLDGLDGKIVPGKAATDAGAKYDAAEYEVDAFVSLYIDDLRIAFLDAQARADAAEAEALRYKADAKAEKSRADKLQAKVDAAEEEEEDEDEESASKEKMDAAVRERADLIVTAREVLDAEQVKKLDGMSNDEIRVACIKSKSPKFDEKGKSSDYIRSRFDALLEAPAGQAQLDALRGDRTDGAPARDLDKLHADSTDKLRQRRLDVRAKHFKSIGRAG